MNSVCHGGDVVTLKELIDYEEKTVAKKEIASNESVRLILMAFDDEALSPHRAPTDALLTILEGEAAVVCEGAECKGRAGDMICFDKGGLHSLKALGKMKTALMLMA